MTKPEDIRKSYNRSELKFTDLTDDPFTLFMQWWNAALNANLIEPNAMTLSTVGPNGQPSSRTVLLKGISNNGFEFYTNYQSKKAIEMEQNPKVALLFFWKELERQIRIEGLVEKLSREQSEKYFQSRPLGSQIGAWASPQSTPIEDREVLDNAVSRIEEKFISQDPLPLPDHWGGYIVKPNLFEFWQGRKDRLHDRFQYTGEKNNWKIVRLAP
jgi:pyridoxamine 5'-phosphate oxidase